MPHQKSDPGSKEKIRLIVILLVKKMNYLNPRICSKSLSLLRIIISFFLLFVNFMNPAFAQEGIKYNPLSKANVYVENGKVIVNAFKSNRFSESEYKNQFRNIKIYRLCCPAFVFGTDYEEFFCGLDYKKSELIFNGYIEPLLDSKFTYTDTVVMTGSTYAYWIASAEGEPLGPLPVKVRDSEAWWSYAKVTDRIKNLRKTYPSYVTVDTIGYTVRLKPLLAVKAGKGKTLIALIGAIHAGESGPELIIPIIEKLIKRNPELLDKISVIAIPSVNCDQRDQLVRGNPWYLRRNANMVDLNRNFTAGWENVDLTYGYKTSDPDGLTYRGPFPASEPETKAVMACLKKNRPKVVFSFHCLAGICGENLLASHNSAENKKYIEQCARYARLYWEGVDPQLSNKLQVGFDCNNGSLPTWCYSELGIPAFDMEAPVDDKDREQCVADRTDVLLLEKYREKHLNGFIRLLKALNE
jgi:hypothetical protein